MVALRPGTLFNIEGTDAGTLISLHQASQNNTVLTLCLGKVVGFSESAAQNLFANLWTML